MMWLDKRRKNIISIVLVMVSAAILAFMLYRLDDSARFSELFVDAGEYGQIISVRTEAANNLLGRLVFDDEELFYDSVADTYYYSLKEDDSDAYNPGVKWGGKEHTTLVVLKQDITPEAIKNNSTIEMLAYNDHEYKKYHLKCTTLPLLNIECQEESIPDAEEVPMDITLFDNSKGAVNRITHSEGMIHVRGASSSNFPKKSYRISLTEAFPGENKRGNHVSLLGMRKDDDWILYSTYDDQEKVRNVFSSNLWKYSCDTDNSYNISTGTEYKYLELFINGEYHGLYALGYPIDEKLLNIDSERNGEYLYKKVHYYDERILRITERGIDGYEVKNGANYEDIVEYQTLIKEWTPLISYYQNLYIHRKNNEELLKGIDIDNAIDIYLFINLIQGVDNVAPYSTQKSCTMIKNMYLTIKNDNGNLVGIYSPWDLDQSWGDSWLKKYDVSPEVNRVMECGYLNEILKNNNSDIWDLIFDKYWKLRNTTWSETFISELLDEYEADIFFSGSYLRDMERWPDGIYREAEDGLNAFREYVSQRLKEADDYYKRLEEIDNKSIYVARSAQYKDFLNNNFIIEINGKNILSDNNYTDLLRYVGVDVNRITDNVSYITVNREQQSIAYLPSSEKNENDSSAIRFLFGKGEAMSEFDFTAGYTFPELTACTDLNSYLNDLKSTNYDVLIEFKNHEILLDRSYIQLLESIGIDTSAIHDNTDIIVIDGDTGKATFADNFYVSGNFVNTAYGKMTVFIDEAGGFGGEAGTYGFYVGEHELYVIDPSENKNTDIRITLIDRMSLEIMDCVSFSYMLTKQTYGYALQTTGLSRKNFY